MVRLRQNTRRLKERALNSLVLAIEFFNRPQEAGRVEATLIFLQHAFETLLKAKIWEERGTITEPRGRISHRFDKCLGIAKSDLGLIDDDEATTLATIDGLRDCAVHYLLEMSEDNLYLHVQAGVTLFAALLERAFGERLANYLPSRVLPVCVSPPQDIQVFLDSEYQHVRSLLAPGRRQQAEVHARLRPLLIMESSLQGEVRQPTTAEVTRAAMRLKGGEDWRTIFPGVAALRLDTSGQGPTVCVRFTRDVSAAPVRVLRPGEEAEGTSLVREVNLLDRYSMGLRELASHLGLTPPKALALMHHIGLHLDEECFKEIRIGSTTFKRYSSKALVRLREALRSADMDHVWQQYRAHQKTGGEYAQASPNGAGPSIRRA